MYYRNANCAVVVYDITQAVSLYRILCPTNVTLANRVAVFPRQSKIMGEGTSTTSQREHYYRTRR